MLSLTTGFFQAGGARLRVEFPTATSERMAGEIEQKSVTNGDCSGMIGKGEAIMNGAEALRSF